MEAMNRISKLFVSMNLEGKSFDVGELVLSGSKIYFKYNPDFLRTGLNLSPIDWPFRRDDVGLI